MYVKIITRQFSIHIYNKPTDDNYIASCMVTCYGDRGLMFLINGAGFYKSAEETFKLCELKGLRTLEGYMTKAHARLLRISCRRFADVVEEHEGMMEGIKMVWVIVTRKLNNKGERNVR